MKQEKQIPPAETERADDKLVVMLVSQKNQTTKKEEELTRKAEELRKAEETSMLNEQCLLEEPTKVKEAQQKEKRNCWKGQFISMLPHFHATTIIMDF